MVFDVVIPLGSPLKKKVSERIIFGVTECIQNTSTKLANHSALYIQVYSIMLMYICIMGYILETTKQKAALMQSFALQSPKHAHTDSHTHK